MKRKYVILTLILVSCLSAGCSVNSNESNNASLGTETVTYKDEHYIKRACIEETSTESVFSVREIIEQMERGLAHLPEPFRPIYRMHVYGGMKVSEISKELGEGYKIVENRLYIARQAIRKRLLAVGF